MKINNLLFFSQWDENETIPTTDNLQVLGPFPYKGLREIKKVGFVRGPFF